MANGDQPTIEVGPVQDIPEDELGGEKEPTGLGEAVREGEIEMETVEDAFEGGETERETEKAQEEVKEAVEQEQVPERQGIPASPGGQAAIAEQAGGVEGQEFDFIRPGSIEAGPTPASPGGQAAIAEQAGGVEGQEFTVQRELEVSERRLLEAEENLEEARETGAPSEVIETLELRAKAAEQQLAARVQQNLIDETAADRRFTFAVGSGPIQTVEFTEDEALEQLRLVEQQAEDVFFSTFEREEAVEEALDVFGELSTETLSRVGPAQEFAGDVARTLNQVFGGAEDAGLPVSETVETLRLEDELTGLGQLGSGLSQAFDANLVGTTAAIEAAGRQELQDTFGIEFTEEQREDIVQQSRRAQLRGAAGYEPLLQGTLNILPEQQEEVDRFLAETIGSEIVAEPLAISPAIPSGVATAIADPGQFERQFIGGAPIFIEGITQPEEIAQEVTGELLTSGAAGLTFVPDIPTTTPQTRFVTGRFREDLLISETESPGLVETFETPVLERRELPVEDLNVEGDAETVAVLVEDTIELPIGRRIPKTRRREIIRLTGVDPLDPLGIGAARQQLDGAVFGGPAGAALEAFGGQRTVDPDVVPDADPTPRADLLGEPEPVFETPSLDFGVTATAAPTQRLDQRQEVEPVQEFEQALEADVTLETAVAERQAQAALFDQQLAALLDQQLELQQQVDLLPELRNAIISPEIPRIISPEIPRIISPELPSDDGQAEDVTTQFLGGEQDLGPQVSLAGLLSGVEEEETPAEFTGLGVRGRFPTDETDSTTRRLQNLL